MRPLPLEAFGIVFAVLAMQGCGAVDPTQPVRDELRQPTGLALAPSGRWLFVTNGNWDRAHSHGTVVAIDLDDVFSALSHDDSRCNAAASNPDVRECGASAFIDARTTVLMGSGLGNIAVDLPGGGGGTPRLLVVQRSPAAIRWLDVFEAADDLRFSCEQDARGICGEQHAITTSVVDPGIRLPRDPSRVVLDRLGFRFAYVPHLAGGAFSLLALDGEGGPTLRAVATDVYMNDPFDDGAELSGGFSVAQRSCAPDDAPDGSRECTRPFLFSTQRYWPGIRELTIAPGLQLVLGGAHTRLDPINPDAVQSRPYMGDLAFEDPDDGGRMLVVQTSPGGLARIDTSLDDDGRSRNQVMQRVTTCGNPNVLAVHRPEGEEPLALVTCFADGALTVIGLATFTVMRTLELGEGANEIVIDHDRQQAYVANTREHTISVVSLDRRDRRFLTEWARIGRRD